MSVFISNIDDFISPAQACVNPYVTARGSGDASKSPPATSSSTGKITLKADFSATEFEAVAVRPNLIKQKVSGSTNDASKVATVSLNDCLACSGCVTSAETVLIQEQSVDKLLQRLAVIQEGSDSSRVVVTISPQSRASIASHLSNLMTSEGEAPVDCAQLFLCLAAWLKQLGAHYVFDTSAAGDIALLEARQEFMNQYSGQGSGTPATFKVPSVSTIPMSATRVQVVSRSNDGSAAVGAAFYSNTGPLQEIADASSMPCYSRKLPLLVSHCPGWVCYAEKTTPAAIPFMSTAKSAQQIVGAVAKRLLSPQEGAPFYVVSVEPCFDKKLEGSRRDFFHEDTGEGEVDLVISTSELWQLVESQSGFAGAAAARWLLSRGCDAPKGRDAIEALFRACSDDGRRLLLASDDSGSGGYLQYLTKFAAQQILGSSSTSTEVVPGRNADITEYVVRDAHDASKWLKFAKVYGFRNIQSLMLKMKKGSCDLAFVEIMACPSGCVNGGGQLKASHREAPVETRARVERVSLALHECIEVRDPESAPLARWLYSGEGGLLGGPAGAEARLLLHTRYHAVPKLDLVAPLAAKW